MIHLKSQYSSPLDIPGVKELPPANKQGFCETMNMIWGRKSDGSELEPSQEPAEVVSLMPAAAAKGKEITKKATTPKTATAPKTAPKAAAAKAKKVSQEPAESKPLPLKSTREPQKRKYLAETEEEPVVKKPKAAAKPKPKPPSTSGSREFKRQTKTTQKKR
jgi:hypothetical protein